jgi:Flp pilus assembly protein TadD
LNPSAAEVHNALGELLLDLNNPKEAIASFRRAAELNPREPSYRQHLVAATERLQAASGR